MCLADGGGGEEGRGRFAGLFVCLFSSFLFFIYLFVYFFYVLCFNLAWESGRIKEKARKPESRSKVKAGY